jgi:hypothetical protein
LALLAAQHGEVSRLCSRLVNVADQRA